MSSVDELMVRRWLDMRSVLMKQTYAPNRDTLDVVAAILTAALIIGDSIPDVGERGPLPVRLVDAWGVDK